MTSRAITLVAAVLSFGTGGPADARAQVRPPSRDAEVRASPAGTGRITGRVVTGTSDRRPVRGAKVTITAGAFALPDVAVTDELGSFEFSNLAAGNYAMQVSRAGYVTAYHGSRTPGRGPGVPIAVVEGESVPHIVIDLLPGAVIAGVVRTPGGQPLARVMVTATTARSQAFDVVAQLNGNATTNQRGEFRMFGLAPDSYLIAARPVGAITGQQGRLVSAGELQWAEQLIRGGTAGSGSPGPPPSPPEPQQPVSYAPVYYPGSPDAAGAIPVTVAAGEERADLVLTLPLVAVADVSGVVLDANGQPASGARIQLGRRGDQSPFAALDLIGASAQTDQEGRFTVRGVAPGEYRLVARLAERPQGNAPEAAMLMAMAIGGTSGGGNAFEASEDVTVQGRDVSGLILRLQPGVTVSGSIRHDGTSPLPAGAGMNALMLARIGEGDPSNPLNLMRGALPVVAGPDGSFSVRGVVPGRYRVVALDVARMAGQFGFTDMPGWSLKSAMLDGRDVADDAFDVRAGTDVAGLAITYTDSAAELSGTVLDRADRGTGAFPIVLFSTSREHWTPMSRRVHLVRPASDGRFVAKGLVAGEYYVCAVTDIDQNALYDPEFLELLVPGSFTITLADGEQKRQDVRLAGG